MNNNRSTVSKNLFSKSILSLEGIEHQSTQVESTTLVNDYCI